MGKAVRKVGQGEVKDEGKVWFGQLRNKSRIYCLCRINIYYIYAERSSKVHLYYCMKNCGQSPDKLRDTILNLIQHYRASLTGKKVFN